MLNVPPRAADKEVIWRCRPRSQQLIALGEGCGESPVRGQSRIHPGSHRNENTDNGISSYTTRSQESRNHRFEALWQKDRLKSSVVKGAFVIAAYVQVGIFLRRQGG